MSHPVRGRPVLGVRTSNVPAPTTKNPSIVSKASTLQTRKVAAPIRSVAAGKITTKATTRVENKTKPRPISFQIYVDENATVNEDDKYNVVKQLERLDNVEKKAEPRVPLSTLHEARRAPSISVSDEAEVKRARPGSSAFEEEDDDSVYGSVKEGSSIPSSLSEYYSAPPGEDDEVVDASAVPLDVHSLREMCVYMRKREEKFRPRQNFLDKQADLSESMRVVLIDWLNDVITEFNMETETLHLAVSMIDRMLSCVEVARQHLQLVGTAALMIAAKYELIFPPELKEFVYVTDDTFTENQILKMEAKILRYLSFDVSVPTAQWFVTHYCNIARSPQVTVHLSNYLVDLSLLEYTATTIRPSVIAAAALCLANIITGPVPWPVAMEEATGITIPEMKTALDVLLAAFNKSATLENKSVYEKYSHVSFCSVSALPGPTTIPSI